MNIPSLVEYEMLEEVAREVADSIDSKKRETVDGEKLFFLLERLFVDQDYPAGPPLTICLSGLVQVLPCGGKMAFRYREITHNDITKNSSVNHDYILQKHNGELVEFGHSMRAAPELPESPQFHFADDDVLDEVAAGSRLLQVQSGNQLELTSGDCGILFDRMMSLKDAR